MLTALCNPPKQTFLKTKLFSTVKFYTEEIDSSLIKLTHHAEGELKILQTAFTPNTHFGPDLKLHISDYSGL